MKKMNKFDLVVLALESQLDCIKKQKALINRLTYGKDRSSVNPVLKENLIKTAKYTIEHCKQQIIEGVNYLK